MNPEIEALAKRIEALEKEVRAMCFNDGNVPTYVRPAPALLKWGCRVEQYVDQMWGVEADGSYLSESLAWINTPPPKGGWRGGTFATRHDALEALSRCTTPPPSWKETECKIAGLESPHVPSPQSPASPSLSTSEAMRSSTGSKTAASDPTPASGLKKVFDVALSVRYGDSAEAVGCINAHVSAVLDAFVEFCHSESRRIGIVPEIACAAHDFKQRNNLP